MAHALVTFAATLALGPEESMNVPACNRYAVTSLDEVIEEEANAVSA